MALYLYSSSKLEYLVKILSKLLNYNKQNLFNPVSILVGSYGMQHWISMELAQIRSIVMNFKFDILDKFIVDICYKINAQNADAQNATKLGYTKDILSWRIYKIINSLDNQVLKKYYSGSSFRKYQISTKIAEVFDNYLKYRPQWLNKWQVGKFINSSPCEDELWQAQLWRALINENPHSPIKIQQQAILNLKNYKNLTNNIYTFGVNTISPQNLFFLKELSRYTNIHIMHTNPCNEYWYELKKDHIINWFDNDDYEAQPLISSLGTQGKDFLKQLLELNNQEIPIFSEFINIDDTNNNSYTKVSKVKDFTLLESLQKNFLEFNTKNYSKSYDRSILFNSCHSSLREIQILHDNLLDLFTKDRSIEPKDVLVMCPNIEDYVPYIESVFTTVCSNYISELPYSIVDRAPIDSEPLISEFIEILKLPESNFEVTKIIDYIYIPALQKKFKLASDKIKTIEYWLKETCIHRGFDGQTFSWQWGLKRLLLGFIYSDNKVILDDKILTLPNLQMQDIVEFGKLYDLIELLHTYSEELNKPKTIKQWQTFLIEMLDELFDISDNDEYAGYLIHSCISKLATVSTMSDFNEKVNLNIIRFILISGLSNPVIDKYFLRGKVTFCSMVPMRSIPFKVVAILGLNNGKFPRKDSSISFDLITKHPRLPGDITKRYNDKYLFLESIISARSLLYLSFQGKSVKNNAKQEPSIVFRDLCYYFDNFYNCKNIVNHYPLQPFSPEVFCGGKYFSFDYKWLKLLKSKQKNFYNNNYQLDTELPKELSITNLVSLFYNPYQAFANYSLKLKFKKYVDELDDSEPFDINNLEKYFIKEQLFKAMLQNKDIQNTTLKLELSGKLPLSPITEEQIIENIKLLQSFIPYVHDTNINNIIEKKIQVEVNCVKLSTEIISKNNQVYIYKLVDITAKDKLNIYLDCLVYALRIKNDTSGIIIYIKNNQVKNFCIRNIKYADAAIELKHYIKSAKTIISKPSLVNIDLLDAYLNQDTQAWYNNIDYSRYRYNTLENNEYYKLFQNKKPRIEEFQNYYSNKFIKIFSKC